MTIIDPDFKEKIKNDAKEFRLEQIKHIKEKTNPTEFETYLIKVLEKELELGRTDEEILRDNYYKIINVLDYWMDIPDEHRNIISLWIIGTYLHKHFNSYPFLFITAMKESGKSRLCRLIAELAKEGEYAHSSLTDAVVFRTKGTIVIDEFEGVGNKEKVTLRELMNSAYKKGVKVSRMKEVKTMQGKDYKVEKFELYRPIVMANIWGMEEVLSDRCITLILDKSNDTSKTALIENFDTNPDILTIRSQFFQCSLCSVVSLGGLIEEWNNYVKEYTHTTLLYTNTNYTNNTQDLKSQIARDRFFAMVKNSTITGRPLELFLPLFYIASIIGEDVLKLTIKIAKNICEEKNHEHEIESKDVMLINFVAQIQTIPIQPDSDYYFIKELTQNFRIFTDSNEEWLNEKWMGRALRRLNLIVDKRRIARGMEVSLNVLKAREKAKLFQTTKVVESIQ